MQATLLKTLDRFLYAGACTAAALAPKPARAPAGRPLILRPGGLGDVVCADIALQNLGLDARDFNWLIEERSRPWALYRGLPHLCHEQHLAAARKTYGRYGLVINAEQHYGLAQAAALLARARGGCLVAFETNRGALWTDRSVPYDWAERHETQEFARLFAAALDLPDVTGPPRLRARSRAGDGPPLVMIAGRQSRSRRLELETWAGLVGKWHRRRPFLIAASPADDPFAAELAGRFRGLATRFAGGFEALCGQIARAEELFTVDGGGVHLASFFGVPTLAVFTSGRDRKWAPLAQGSRIVRRNDLPCQPCTKFGQVPACAHRYACLDVAGVKPVAIGGSYAALTGAGT